VFYQKLLKARKNFSFKEFSFDYLKDEKIRQIDTQYLSALTNGVFSFFIGFIFLLVDLFFLFFNSYSSFFLIFTFIPFFLSLVYLFTYMHRPCLCDVWEKGTDALL